MSKKRRSLLLNILFFIFLFFLFTPYSLETRAKLTQGLTYLKGFITSPEVNKINNRKTLDNYNTVLSGINNANNTNLNDLKGNVVLINHWATWCPPCRAEMPSLNKLYKDYSEKVTFLFLTTDTKQVVEKYYKENDFDFPTYNLNSQLPEQINTRSIPATFILDKNGNVALEEFGPADWNNKKVRETIDGLLAE